MSQYFNREEIGPYQITHMSSLYNAHDAMGTGDPRNGMDKIVICQFDGNRPIKIKSAHCNPANGPALYKKALRDPGKFFDSMQEGAVLE